jgi:hypothetical protein
VARGSSGLAPRRRKHLDCNASQPRTGTHNEALVQVLLCARMYETLDEANIWTDARSRDGKDLAWR